MTVSVMITTHNRAEDLATTLRALSSLDPKPHEVLITLDGCTDTSRECVDAFWPSARVFENRESQGSIPARDQMLREARGDLMLSLDDDSYPLESDFLPCAAAFFERDPQLAVLSFPQRSEEFPASLLQSDFGPDLLVASYASSGAVLRRCLYLSLPGFPKCFAHIYEEPDYALQCIARGRSVRMHTGLTIRHHYSSVNRNEMRIHQQHARNECWSVLLRCPAPWWPLVMFKRAAGQFLYACRRGPTWLLREPIWWWRALAGARAIWQQRRPVAWSSYQRWRRLLRNPEVT